MPRLRLRIGMSLDGYAAGPMQSVDHPMGVGGMRLHQWILPLAAWRSHMGLEGGITNASSAERLFVDIGDGFNGLELVDTIPAPGVVHLKLSRP